MGCLIALTWKQVLRIAPGARIAIGILGMVSATFYCIGSRASGRRHLRLRSGGFILAGEAAQSWSAKGDSAQKAG